MCDEALPRRNVFPTKLGFAPWSGLRPRVWATGRTTGTAPRCQALFRRGIAIASHQGGEAAKQEFLCKAPDNRKYRFCLTPFKRGSSLRSLLTNEGIKSSMLAFGKDRSRR